MSDGPIVAAAKSQGIDNHNAWRRNKGLRELSVMEFLNND